MNLLKKKDMGTMITFYQIWYLRPISNSNFKPCVYMGAVPQSSRAHILLGEGCYFNKKRKTHTSVIFRVTPTPYFLTPVDPLKQLALVFKIPVG